MLVRRKRLPLVVGSFTNSLYCQSAPIDHGHVVEVNAIVVDADTYRLQRRAGLYNVLYSVYTL